LLSEESQGVPSVESVLGVLSTMRLLNLCRLYGCEVHHASKRDRLARTLSELLRHRLPALLGELGRDELRAVCRRHGIDHTPRARAELQAGILDAAGIDRREVARAPSPPPDGLPERGRIRARPPPPMAR
jgi:hypothetical protein